MDIKKIILLIVLGIGAVFSLIYGISAPAKGKYSSAVSKGQQASVDSGKVGNPAEQAIRNPRRAKRTKFTTWSRNPFLQKRDSGGSSGLTGILWDEKTPKAIINEAVVSIGNKIGEITVIDIKKDHVILNDGTKDYEVKLE